MTAEKPCCGVVGSLFWCLNFCLSKVFNGIRLVILRGRAKDFFNFIVIQLLFFIMVVWSFLWGLHDAGKVGVFLLKV